MSKTYRHNPKPTFPFTVIVHTATGPEEFKFIGNFKKRSEASEIHKRLSRLSSPTVVSLVPDSETTAEAAKVTEAAQAPITDFLLMREIVAGYCSESNGIEPIDDDELTHLLDSYYSLPVETYIAWMKAVSEGKQGN